MIARCAAALSKKLNPRKHKGTAYTKDYQGKKIKTASINKADYEILQKHFSSVYLIPVEILYKGT